jgi:hypothetical protein
MQRLRLSSCFLFVIQNNDSAGVKETESDVSSTTGEDIELKIFSSKKIRGMVRVVDQRNDGHCQRKDIIHDESLAPLYNLQCPF